MSGLPGERPATRGTRRLAAALFAAALIAAAVTVRDYGVASDVPNYFAGSLRQLHWAGELVRATVDLEPGSVLSRDAVLEAWRWNQTRIPHPPLSRELSGLSWVALRGLTDPLTAYRGAVMVAFAALVAACGGFTATLSGSRGAGLLAGVAAMGIPALFANGHLAHTDLFLAAFWFGSAMCAATWAREGRNGWLVASGLLLGAAVATKFTGLLLAPVLGTWAVVRRPRSAAAAIALLGLLAAAVWFVVNPVAWVDPRLALGDYFGAGLDRASDPTTRITTEYFGRIYAFRPPRSYPFFWLGVSLPVGLLVAAVVGLLRGRPRDLAAFCVLNAAALLAALMLPSAPMHDGVRLFLPVLPFVAVLAGLGTEYLAARAAGLVGRRAGPERARAVYALVALLLLAPALGSVARSHPFQLSYANALVGGVRGLERQGLEVTNLKEVMGRDVLADLAAGIPAGAVVDPGFFLEELCFDRALGLVPDSWRIESRVMLPTESAAVTLACEGPLAELPRRVERDASRPDYVFVLNRKGQWRSLEWALFRSGAPPFYEVSWEGVPLMQVYRTR